MSKPDDTASEVLKRHWGHDAFRGPQAEAIEGAIRGRDVLVVMATGGGKSMCLQIPPLVLGKVGLVVSPLISLMEDQVAALVKRGVRACMLGSAQADWRVREDAWAGKYQIVYLTPELAVSPQGMLRIARLQADVGVALLAVDEAHCISEWGRDFRPDFQRLGELRAVLPGVPVVAATATATPRVRSEILERMRMTPENTDVFIESFERPNLRFEAVARKAGGAKAIAAWVAAAIGANTPAIVYVLTTRSADELAEALSSFKASGQKRLTAAAYHAKLDAEQRTRVHEAFLRDDPDGPSIIVATLAYGMGIDKPNVRTVVHAGAPASLEAYYQQAGRAGRDGLPSTCVLLWSTADVSAADQVRGGGGGGPAHQSPSLRSAISQGTTDVQAYIASSVCRAAQLSCHFTGINAVSTGRCRGGCDRCDSLQETEEKDDFGSEARALMLAVRATNCRFGLGKAVSLLMPPSAIKRKADEPPAWLVARAKDLGVGLIVQDTRSEAWWKSLAGMLIAERMLEYYTATVGGSSRSFSAPRLTAKGSAWLAEAPPQPLMLVPSDEIRAFKLTPQAPPLTASTCTNISTGPFGRFARVASATVQSPTEDKAVAAERRRLFLSTLEAGPPQSSSANLLEKPGDAAVDALEAYLGHTDRDVDAVAAARGGVKPSTIASSLARCAAHGMMPEAELDGFARKCGGFERGSEVALALAACMRDAEPPGAVGAALKLARARGLTLARGSELTYHHMHVAAALG